MFSSFVTPAYRNRLAFAALVVLAAAMSPVDVHAAAEEGEAGGLVSMIAKLANFAILVGVLVYFLKAPIAAYLTSRSGQIRQDLVTAADMRASASAQLAEIEKKMRSLPAELEALKRRGAEDVEAEKARIAQAAVEERNRLFDHAHREIEGRLRLARRDLKAHAAELAVRVARQRIESSMTPDDQLRLVDRYASQLRESR